MCKERRSRVPPVGATLGGDFSLSSSAAPPVCTSMSLLIASGMGKCTTTNVSSDIDDDEDESNTFRLDEIPLPSLLPVPVPVAGSRLTLADDVAMAVVTDDERYSRSPRSPRVD